MKKNNSNTHKELLKASSIVILGSGAVHIANYLFTIVIAKYSSPTNLAEITSLISLITLIGFPTSVITLYTAKLYANNQSTPNTNNIIKQILQASLLLTTILLLTSRGAGNLLTVNQQAIRIVIIALPLMALTSIYKGVLQGKKKFHLFSAINIAESLTKIIFTIILLKLFPPIIAVAGALSMSNLTAYLLSKTTAPTEKAQKNTSHISESKTNTLTQHSEILPIAISSLLILTLINIDLILAKAVLPNIEAGTYAALATLGKIITYGAPSASASMLPFIVQDEHNTQAQQKTLYITLAITLVIIGIFSTAKTIWPQAIITILLSTKYLIITPYIPTIILITSMWAIITVFTTFFIAQKKYNFTYYFGIILTIEIVTIILLPHTINTILNILLYSAFTLSIVMAKLALYPQKRIHENPIL